MEQILDKLDFNRKSCSSEKLWPSQKTMVFSKNYGLIRKS